MEGGDERINPSWSYTILTGLNDALPAPFAGLLADDRCKSVAHALGQPETLVFESCGSEFSWLVIRLG